MNTTADKTLSHSISKQVIKRNKFFGKYWQVDRDLDRLERRFNRSEKILPQRNSFYVARLKSRVTPTEVIVGDYLWNNHVYFKFQKGFFKPFHRIVDFYIPRFKVILEIDGGYHNIPETLKKDASKDIEWNKKGYTTVRITNDEVINGSFIDKLRGLIDLSTKSPYW